MIYMRLKHDIFLFSKSFVDTLAQHFPGDLVSLKFTLFLCSENRHVTRVMELLCPHSYLHYQWKYNALYGVSKCTEMYICPSSGKSLLLEGLSVCLAS